MTKHITHSLRLNEVISPFGVGAITNIKGESLIACDTSWWDLKYSTKIECDRLLEQLGHGELRSPPTNGDGDRASKHVPALPYNRFPTWRFCEQCSKLSRNTRIEGGRTRIKCSCGGGRVPIRFVAVCKSGSHIQDIPWFRWTHSGFDSGVTEEVRVCKSYDQLIFSRDSKSGEGLQSLSIRCLGCKRHRTLDKLVIEGSLAQSGITCNARQPWQRDSEVDGAICSSPLVAVQRGATGNYMPIHLSALDIPEELPESAKRASSIIDHDLFQRLKQDNNGPKSDVLAEMIAEDLKVDTHLVRTVANEADNLDKFPGNDDNPLTQLKDGEWAAFLQKFNSRRDSETSEFVVDTWQPERQGDANDTILTTRISGVGQVRKVKEVRALTGFQRYAPEAAVIPVSLGAESQLKPIYPTIELFGEGIFIRFDESQVRAWEQIPEVKARANILAGRYNASPPSHNRVQPDPRFIALHTLAHLLIRRLAFDSGYSSASLRERIYADSSRTDRTAGILIYTAAGDSQGTLGGLVRLGAKERLIPLVLQALDDADICSNDPVCLESDSQGAAMMNLAACHGCSLISETSCETQNRLLDRQLLLGGQKVKGLLQGLLDEARVKQFQA